MQFFSQFHGMVKGKKFFWQPFVLRANGAVSPSRDSSPRFFFCKVEPFHSRYQRKYRTKRNGFCLAPTTLFLLPERVPCGKTLRYERRKTAFPPEVKEEERRRPPPLSFHFLFSQSFCAEICWPSFSPLSSFSFPPLP